MISLLLAAALRTSPTVIAQHASTPPARFVRLKVNLNGYGIDGSGSIAVDRQTGRYVEHLALGPQSLYQGFDGVRAWQADATGMPAVQGNPVDRGTILAWGYVFAFPRTARVHGSFLHYAGVPQTASFELEPGSHYLRQFVMSNGSFNEVARFAGYRRFAGGITAPQSITFTDDNGTWKGRVTDVQAIPAMTAGDFAPPSPPRGDASIAGGLTTVPFEIATEIVIPVRINDGPVMRFILDTGGQNVITAASAKRLGLPIIGAGTVGGAGAGVIPIKFATVRSVRIGGAQMRNQPFLVFDTDVLRGIDGIVGFELLSRFAARIDYAHNTLSLAPSVPSTWITGVTPTPFSYRSRQPLIAGALDGFPAALSIDTGSSGVLDVNTPFAREHDLWDFYHARKPKTGDIAGVGGSVLSSNIVVRHLQLGQASLADVRGDLTQATAGIEADPAIAANVGEGVFRNFTFVLDYPHERLYFAPGGLRDMSGVNFARHGNRIVVSKVLTRRAKHAGIRPGMTLTSLNGKEIGADGLAAVQARLAGQQPGTDVQMVLDGTKHVTLKLLNYL